MTHAATATRTLRSSRRSASSSAAGERVGTVSGVVGITALVAAACVLASTPSVNSTTAAVRSHLADRYPLTMATAYAVCVGALLLVPFLASLRTFSARQSNRGQWRSTVTLVLGTVGIAMLALAGALLATATLLADRTADAEAVFAAFIAAKLVATLALLPVAGLVFTNARTIAAGSPRSGRWLVRFDIEIAAAAVIASVASFADPNTLAPGGPAVAGAWFLLALWVIALARTIAHDGHVNTSEATS